MTSNREINRSRFPVHRRWSILNVSHHIESREADAVSLMIPTSTNTCETQNRIANGKVVRAYRKPYFLQEFLEFVLSHASLAENAK